MEDTGSTKRKLLVGLTVVLGLSFFALNVVPRLWGLTTYGLWMDEVFSVRIARLPWIELFQQTAADAVHPPFFYIILKLWMLIADSLLWLKLLPLTLAIQAEVILVFLANELDIDAVNARFVSLLIALNAFFIYYAQELRMYSLLMFLGLLSMWVFVRFVNDRGWRPEIILFIVNLLMVYTHYFGWLTVAAEGVALVILYRTKLRVFVLHCVGLFIVFLPWALAVLSVAASRGTISGNVAWIDRPPVLAIPVFLADIQGRFGGVRSTIGVGMLIFMTPLAIWLWQNRRDTETRRLAILLGSLTAVPIAVAFIVSQVLTKSIWVDRYLIATGIPFLLLLAVAACRIRPRALSVTFVVLTLGWSLGAGTWNLLYWRERVNWTSLAADLVASRKAPVYTNEAWVELPLTEAMMRAGRPTEVQIVGTPSGIHAAEFWFGYRKTAWNGERSPEEMFAEEGCSVTHSATDSTAMERVFLLHVLCPANGPS